MARNGHVYLGKASDGCLVARAYVFHKTREKIILTSSTSTTPNIKRSTIIFIAHAAIGVADLNVVGAFMFSEVKSPKCL